MQAGFRDILDLLTERMRTLKSLGSLDTLKDDHLAHIKDRIQVWQAQQDSHARRGKQAHSSGIMRDHFHAQNQRYPAIYSFVMVLCGL